MGTSMGSWRWSLPSGFITQNFHWPVRLLRKTMCCPSGLQTGATLCGSGVYRVVAGRVSAVTFEPSRVCGEDLPVILFQAVEDDAIAAGLRGRILIAILAEHGPVLALVGHVLGDLEARPAVEDAALGPIGRERVRHRGQILVAPAVAIRRAPAPIGPSS